MNFPTMATMAFLSVPALRAGQILGSEIKNMLGDRAVKALIPGASVLAGTITFRLFWVATDYLTEKCNDPITYRNIKKYDEGYKFIQDMFGSKEELKIAAFNGISTDLKIAGTISAFCLGHEFQEEITQNVGIFIEQAYKQGSQKINELVVLASEAIKEARKPIEPELVWLEKKNQLFW